MESGLEGRNNLRDKILVDIPYERVSMESGLEGRNNWRKPSSVLWRTICLNGVRPRRPEQWLASEGCLD